jgi:transposase
LTEGIVVHKPQENKQLQITWTIPLELKIQNGIDVLLEAFKQNARLVKFFEEYYSTRYPYMKLVNAGFIIKGNDWDDLIAAAERRSITLTKDMIGVQVGSKILATYKAAYHSRHKPPLEALENIISVRVAKTYPENKKRRRVRGSTNTREFAKKRSGSFTLLADEKNPGELTFYFRPFGQYAKAVSGRVGYEENFDDKARYQEALNAVTGKGGLEAGMSEIHLIQDRKTQQTRFFIHLVVNKVAELPIFAKKKPIGRKAIKKYYDERRQWWAELEHSSIIIGVDLGMSKYLAAAAAIDRSTDECLGTIKVDARDIIKTIMREKKRQARSQRRTMKNKMPYGKGEKGYRLARLTRLGKSRLEQEYRRLTYHAVNIIVRWATELATKRSKRVIIRIEHLSSFCRKTQTDSRLRRMWGLAYNRARDPEAKARALQQKRNYADSTKIASWFRYGLFRDDMFHEANKYGHLVRVVSARNSSIRCPECGHRDKVNRRNRDDFCCVNCGYSDEADVVASRNLVAS